MNQSGSQLTREQLYEKVWSAPTTQVAAELGISDVALAKRCKKLSVPKPSLGYWAKVAAGQKAKKVPLPPLPPSAGEIFAQTAEKPLPKTLSLPETTEQLHPLAVELLRRLAAAKPSYDKRLWSQELTLPARTRTLRRATRPGCRDICFRHVDSERGPAGGESESLGAFGSPWHL